MKKTLQVVALLACLFTAALPAFAQVTTSAMNGTVVDQNGQPLPGANVVLVHEPTGSRYGTTTRVDGGYLFSNVKVGGPYTLRISYVSYSDFEVKNLNLSLGQNLTVNATLSEQTTQLDELQVTAVANPILNSDRTGAATAIDTRSIEQMPTISRRIGDFTRLTPQASGSSFAGFDNRLNNITVDGASFNNSFGLQGQPGDRTGVAPISIDAIEQISVNIAPYDVRQGGFVGAGVNTVTKSGTNQFKGTVYTQRRNQNFVGTEARGNNVPVGNFDYNQIGFALGGPIVKDKVFFFTSFERDAVVQPGTTYRTRTSKNDPFTGNITRVVDSDMVRLQSFLRDSLNYDPGVYQGYDFETPATRFLAKFDFNINDKNKFTLRYTHLNSETDVLLSNSSSLGFGTRRSNNNSLNFSNSNYKIMENIRSLVGELNSTFNNSMSNNLVIGYTYQDESRRSPGSLFPFVDILDGTSVYTSFGTEPFTPNNELRYKTFQIQNNFVWVKGQHTFTFGGQAEWYESENVFFPGSQSVYVYNSLNDFYTDARGWIANPNRTTSPVALNRFQVRYNNIPGQEKPVQPLEVFMGSLYAQDEFRYSKDLKITLGIRADRPSFGDTGYPNAIADTLDFRDENGNTVNYSTGDLPAPTVLWSPRIGFNWDVKGDKSTQLRGGTGIFTGRPAYVWISNQIGNTGVLTGFDERISTNTAPVTNRPFNPDPDKYKPDSVSGAPAARYELALTNRDFRFPQIWRTNLAIDQKLPILDLVASAEVIFSRDINGIYYINANLDRPDAKFFNGADSVSRWTSTNASRIHDNISSAVVLKNQNEGRAMNVSFSLERPMINGLFLKAGYNYGVSRNTVDPGSIASGSWSSNQHTGDPNNPGLAFSTNRSGHRLFAAVSYKKKIFSFGETMVSVFAERRNNGTASFTYGGDINGDGGTSNDLLYVPKDQSEMNFVPYTGRTSRGTDTLFTAQMQKDAWEAFIKQDDYLSSRRGKYAMRNGLLLPFVSTIDVSVSQDFAFKVSGKEHRLQFRADVMNFANLLNPEWGVSQSLVTNQPLVVPTERIGGRNVSVPVDANKRLQYNLRNFNGHLITKSYINNATINDVWRAQFSLRYMF